MMLLIALALLQTDTTHLKVKQLSDVVVKAQKPVYEQNAYGTLVNVSNDVLATGSSALEALQRAPGIRVDPRYNTLSLNGKSGVIVMIDGRVSHMSGSQLMTFLNSLNADDIERFELMTTPPANVDASGSAGVINIVLKRDRKTGNHAALTATGGYGQYEKFSGSLRLEHNTKKVNLWTSYSVQHNHAANTLTAVGSEIVPQWSGLTTFAYGSSGTSISDAHTVQAGIDIKPDDKTTVSMGAYHTWDPSHYTNHNTVAYAFPDSAFSFDGYLSSRSHWRGGDEWASVERRFRGSGKVKLLLDYEADQPGTSGVVQSTFLDQHGKPVDPNDTAFAPEQQTWSGAVLHSGTAQLDYSQPIGKSWTLEAGAKADYSHNLSGGGVSGLVNGVWVDRGGTQSELLVRENIDAAYASLHVRLDSTLTLIAGVRYEYSHTLGTSEPTGTDTLDRKLGGFFPDVFLTKIIAPRQTLQLSYTKRITRPGYDDLSNAVGYNDPLSVFTGNPLLQPTITQNLKFGYTNRGYSVSLLASHDRYPIARWQVVAKPGSDLIYIMPENLDYQDQLMLQAVLPLKLTSWWDINTTFTGGWTRYAASFDPQPYTKTFPGANIDVTGIFRLPQHITVEVYGNYTTRSYYAANRDAGNAALSLGIKKELSATSNLLLSVTDICRMQYINTLGTVTRDAFASDVWVSYRPESWVRPVLKLSYTRSFGPR